MCVLALNLLLTCPFTLSVRTYETACFYPKSTEPRKGSKALPAHHLPSARIACPSHTARCLAYACVRQASRACTLLCSSCNQREAPPQRSSFNKPSLSNPCMPEVLLSEKECFEKSYDAFSRSVDRSRVYMYACKLLTCRVRIVRDLHEPRHGC